MNLILVPVLALAALACVGGVALLLIMAGRGEVRSLARLTSVFATITLIGIGISLAVRCYTLLFSPTVDVSVALDPTPIRLPEGLIDPHSIATVVSGGADRASLVVSGLTLTTRLVLLGSEVAGGLTIGAVALIALRATGALRNGDIFTVAYRAIMTAAVIVMLGGIAWTVLGDIGSWRAGIEALRLDSWGAQGALGAELAGASDTNLVLAEHGWPTPLAGPTITLPLWPISVGLGLAVVATAFRMGQRLRTDVTRLSDDVRGLV